jgi:hypothetical protein
MISVKDCGLTKCGDINRGGNIYSVSASLDKYLVLK